MDHEFSLFNPSSFSALFSSLQLLLSCAQLFGICFRNFMHGRTSTSFDKFFRRVGYSRNNISLFPVVFVRRLDGFYHFRTVFVYQTFDGVDCSNGVLADSLAKLE